MSQGFQKSGTVHYIQYVARKGVHLAWWQINTDSQINFVSLYIKGVRNLFNL